MRARTGIQSVSITTPASVAIQPYHRLVSHAPVPVPGVLERLAASGAMLAEGEVAIPPPGTVILYAEGSAHAVRLPASGGTVVDAMDHSVVERLVLGEALGLEPGDKRIVYVGGDYPPAWLASEVGAVWHRSAERRRASGLCQKQVYGSIGREDWPRAHRLDRSSQSACCRSRTRAPASCRGLGRYLPDTRVSRARTPARSLRRTVRNPLGFGVSFGRGKRPSNETRMK